MKISIIDLVRNRRKLLQENQVEFGKRFGVPANTVSRWESGLYGVPQAVIEELLGYELEICSYCFGVGYQVKLKT